MIIKVADMKIDMKVDFDDAEWKYICNLMDEIIFSINVRDHKSLSN